MKYALKDWLWLVSLRFDKQATLARHAFETGLDAVSLMERNLSAMIHGVVKPPNLATLEDFRQFIDHWCQPIDGETAPIFTLIHKGAQMIRLWVATLFLRETAKLKPPQRDYLDALELHLQTMMAMNSEEVSRYIFREMNDQNRDIMMAWVALALADCPDRESQMTQLAALFTLANGPLPPMNEMESLTNILALSRCVDQRGHWEAFGHLGDSRSTPPARLALAHAFGLGHGLMAAARVRRQEPGLGTTLIEQIDAIAAEALVDLLKDDVLGHEMQQGLAELKGTIGTIDFSRPDALQILADALGKLQSQLETMVRPHHGFPDGLVFV